MNPATRLPSPFLTTLVGALGLTSAMGIGRFAFTPLLPLMQQSDGLTVTQGGWIATANYLGYLIGALICFGANPAPDKAARAGLVGVALLTMAMGLTHDVAIWMALRLLAGVASALVLVGISSWALGVLVQWQRTHLYGTVFAGVGSGMTLAGLVGLVAGVRHDSPDHAWLALGACALAVVIVAWRPLGLGVVRPSRPAVPTSGPARRTSADEWRMIVCYGLYGIGYIIPATFLPAYARQLLADPSVFGWVWPVFGLAAVVSTVMAGVLLRAAAPRKVWAAAQIVMALGVAAPIVAPGLVTIVLSALSVGGTFVAVTMLATQDARLVAGAAAPRLIAAMTAAFAIGQLLGPLTMRAGSLEQAMVLPSLAAAGLLLLSSVALLWRRRESSGA